MCKHPMCSDRLENKRPALLHGGERAGWETCGVYRRLQQCCVLPYLGKPFHEGLVAGGLLHVVVELHPHQQTCTDAQRRFEQHGGGRRERTAAVQDVVQHFVGYARLCSKLRLRQVAAFDFLLKPDGWGVDKYIFPYSSCYL